MRQKRIRANFDKDIAPEYELGGWYAGKRSYLWFGKKIGPCCGIISGQKLYRMAKAIVKNFEEDN